MMVYFNMFLMLLCVGFTWFIGACASEQTITKTQVKTDWRGNEQSFSVGKDEDGNPVMKSSRRSSLEGKQNVQFANRDFSGENYATPAYRKKRWFGNKDYERQDYRGNTDANDYRREPWYVQKQVSAASKRADIGDKKFAVNPFRKKSAREQGGERLDRPADAETEERQSLFQQPDITDWKKQQGLSIKDTNKMLGR